MRITDNMLSDRLLENLYAHMERIAKTQDKLSSGKRISKPSDDPVGTFRALDLRTVLAENKQYQKNIDYANGWLENTDGALESVWDLLLEAQSTGDVSSPDTVPAEVRKANADVVNQYLAEIVQQANSKQGGKYIFGGTQTLSPAYTTTTDSEGNITAVTANPKGITGSISRKIGSDNTLVVNVSGNDVLEGGGSGKNIFNELMNLRIAMDGNDTQGIKNAVDNLADALDQIASYQSNIGSRMNVLDLTKNRLQSVNLATADLLSNLEDADMAKTIIEFEMQQNIYRAALATGARIIQPSLLDFLR